MNSIEENEFKKNDESDIQIEPWADYSIFKGNASDYLLFPYKKKKKAEKEPVIYLPCDNHLKNPSGQPREYEPNITKKKFPRDWANYTLSRQKEKRMALDLLSEAIRMLSVKTHGNRRGRPPYPLPDKIFLCVQKVLRNATYDSNEEFIEYAKLKRYIICEPRPHSVADFMNDAQITPILEQLIVLTSTPLATSKKKCAIDSTGISTLDKSRWVKIKFDLVQHRGYRKIHTIVDTVSNVIMAARVTIGTQHDSPMLLPLLDMISSYFEISEFTGDAAYTSRKNAQAIADKGAMPFFKLSKRLKSLAKGHYPAWNKMINTGKKRPIYYDAKYHRRSNVESVYAMIKRKINEFVRSKNSVSQTNEALCLAVAHNLFCLVTAHFCDDLTLEFKK